MDIVALLICTIVPIKRAIKYNDRKFIKVQTVIAISCTILATAFTAIDMRLCQVTTFSAIIFSLNLIMYAALITNCLDELDKLDKSTQEA